MAQIILQSESLIKLIYSMDILKNLDLRQIIGGGYWWRDSDGNWYYCTDDEEPEGDDIIWG